MKNLIRVLCLTVIFCTQLTLQAQSEKPIAQKIHQAVVKFQEAYNSGDASALSSIFTTDARVIDYTGQILDGQDAIRQRYHQQFQVTNGKLEISENEVLSLGKDHAVLSGGYAGTLTINATGEESDVEGMYGTVLQKVDGTWKIKRHMLMRPAPGMMDKSTNKEFDQFIASYIKAQKDGNAQLCASMYAKEAQLTLPDGQILKGRANIENYMKQSHQQAQVDMQITYDDILPLANGQFLIQGSYDMKRTVKADGSKQKISAHYSTLMQKKGGQWEIVRQLNMVPIQTS